MFRAFTNGCVKLVNRYLPDPFIFCIILTVVVFIGALPATGATPIQLVGAWGSEIWSLLEFSMQMALVLVLGNALANARPIKKVISTIAGIAKTPPQAIVMVTFIALVACWINWGFGLVVGAILAKETAKKVKGVDYRLVIAAAYSGFVIWHAGISGSIPLALATPGKEALMKATGGVVTDIIPTTETIFAPWNLAMVIVVVLVLPFIISKMHPSPEETISIDPELLKEKPEEKIIPTTPAEKLENSVVMTAILAVIVLGALVYYFVYNGFNLTLNVVNLIFLFLGIVFHKTPISYVKAIAESAKGTAGIILQFPFYAGIMGLMTFSLSTPDYSLAGVVSNFFVSISNKVTFPLLSFLSAGIVNFFVPSGGGQWAVQGPIMMPAGELLGIAPSVTGMAIAWGDAWTNMIQPFWALPALGIAGLSARDIMGYCIITLLFVGLVVCGGFLVVGMLNL